MKGCDEYGTTIPLYLDREMSGRDFDAFRLHLYKCAACEVGFEEEERLSALLRRSRPLYSASDSLRADVIRALQSYPSPTSRVRVSHWTALAAALLLVAGSLFVPALRRQSSAASYIDTAIAAHRRILTGTLPLEVLSGSPSVVTAWFAGKVPFTFRLPTSADNLQHQPVYRLTGARLVDYKGRYAALVAYQMQQQQISLLVSPAVLPSPQGESRSLREECFSITASTLTSTSSPGALTGSRMLWCRHWPVLAGSLAWCAIRTCRMALALPLNGNSVPSCNIR
jgi:hypothetical protein